MSVPCEVKKVTAGYGEMVVIRDVSLSIREGQKVALIGPNGAGKTTLVNVIVSLLKPKEGDVYIFGKNTKNLKPYEVAEMGVRVVPEGGRVFPRLSVLENLLTAVQGRKDYGRLDVVFTLFPRLKERRDQLAETLSGGEQRMLAIARALAGNPKLLILDELSLGLGPKIVSEIYRALMEAWEEFKISILLIEQYVRKALEFSDTAYVIEGGEIKLEGPSRELINNDYVKKVYLGLQ